MASKSKIRPPALNFPPVTADSSSSDEEDTSSEAEQEEKQQQPPTVKPEGKQNRSGTEKDEDDEDESDEEDEEDDDEEEAEPTPKSQPPVDGKKPKPQPAAENDVRLDSDSLDDSDSDSGEPVKPPIRVGTSDSTPKPINSKPISSKPISVPGTPSKRSRPEDTEMESVKPSKSKKSKNVKEESDVKKTPMFWGESDEIALLDGILGFQRKKGLSIHVNPTNFHEYMNGKLSMRVEKTQLMEKVRRLKEKYKRVLDKTQDGKDPYLPKSHDAKCFMLSKKIWDSDSVANGSNNGSRVGVDENANKISTRAAKKSGNKSVANGSSVVTNDAAVVAVPLGVEVGKVVKGRKDEAGLAVKYPNLTWAMKPHVHEVHSHEHQMHLKLMWESVGVLSESELKELDNSWKQMNINELELVIKQMDLMKSRADLVKEQTNKILNALKSL